MHSWKKLSSRSVVLPFIQTEGICYVGVSGATAFTMVITPGKS